MSNVSINEGGVSRNFNNVDLLIIQDTNGNDTQWASEDVVGLTNLSVTENGEYEIGSVDPEHYGWEEVSVSVNNYNKSFSGVYYGDEYNITGDYEIDEYGNVLSFGDFTFESLPAYLVITTPPTKLEYSDGEAIDLTGIVVTAKKADGTTWTSSQYPDGIIPVEELTISPSVAEIKANLKSNIISADGGVFNFDALEGRFGKLLYCATTTLIRFDYKGSSSGRFDVPTRCFLYDNGVCFFRQYNWSIYTEITEAVSHQYLYTADTRKYMMERYGYYSDNAYNFNHVIEDDDLRELSFSGTWSEWPDYYLVKIPIRKSHDFKFEHNGIKYNARYFNLPAIVRADADSSFDRITYPEYTSIEGVSYNGYPGYSTIGAETEGDIQHDDLDAELQEIITAWADGVELNKGVVKLTWNHAAGNTDLSAAFIINVVE